MHYVEELIDSYLGERIHSMKKSNEVAVNWSMVRDISEYCLYDKDGCRKDLQEMIDEMEYLLDIRHRLKCQRSSDATDESSQDLSREEVARCYYIWKVDFLQSRLGYDQDPYKPVNLRGRWNPETKQYLRSMMQKYAGHFRVGMAIFQKGLDVRAMQPGVEHHQLAYNERAKMDIADTVDFFILCGESEGMHRATEEYETALRQIWSCTQFLGNPSSNRARRKTWLDIQRARKFQERRDREGVGMFGLWDLQLLSAYEAGHLSRRMRRLRLQYVEEAACSRLLTG